LATEIKSVDADTLRAVWRVGVPVQGAEKGNEGAEEGFMRNDQSIVRNSAAIFSTLKILDSER
jgi:hypothetical protein